MVAVVLVVCDASLLDNPPMINLLLKERGILLLTVVETAVVVVDCCLKLVEHWELGRIVGTTGSTIEVVTCVDDDGPTVVLVTV